MLLTFAVYFMALDPAVTRRLRAEVLEHCGRDGAPTPDALKAMTYSAPPSRRARARADAPRQCAR